MLSRYKSSLIALFERVHMLQADPTGKRLLALEIQEELLQRTGRAERVIRRTRTEIDELKSRLTQRGNDKATSLKLKNSISALTDKIAIQKDIRGILGAIGDSIAFIYGDRWDLRQLVKHESAGFITSKQGTRFERRALRRIFSTTTDAVAVLNDLTHTLRYGDITVFSPAAFPDGRFGLIELKSGRGGSRSRIARQSEALKELSDYLTTDVRQGADGSTWRRESIVSDPEYHFDTLGRLIEELSGKGWLLREIEPGLHYGVINYEYGDSFTTELMEAIENAKGHKYLLYFTNDMKYTHDLAYYPFPLCFNNAEALFKFYNAELLIFVIVDMNKVNEMLAQHGLSASVADRKHFAWKIVTLNDIEEGWWYVSSHMVGRLAGEFLKLDWLLNNTVSAVSGMSFSNALPNPATQKSYE